MNHTVSRRTLCAAVLSGCAAPRLGRAQSGATLEIGVLPNISARVLLAQYQPMREYLARTLNRPVQVSTAPNWNVFHQRTLAREYDVVVTAANLARLAEIDRGYVPLLVYTPNIRGLLVSASARPLKAAADLRGQTLVLSNPQSLVTLRGMQWLAELGLQRERDFKTSSTPTDDSVGGVVVRGDAMAAMLSGGEFRAIPEAIRSQLQVFSTFAEVSGFVVMASPLLAAGDQRDLKERLRQFATASDEGKAFFASSGFTGMREPEVGELRAMDAFVEATRKVMAPG